MQEHFWRDAALKATPQRQEILHVLLSENRPLTAEELFALLPGGKANRSTVYRTLGALVKKGLLIKTVRTDGTADYQPCGERHCHQMVCMCCGERSPLPACPLMEVSHRLEESTGYVITGHSLEFTGLCPMCQKKTPRR